MDYPKPEDLGDFAKQIIMEVMAPRAGSSTGSDKSGPVSGTPRIALRILSITPDGSLTMPFQLSALAMLRWMLMGKLVRITGTVV